MKTFLTTLFSAFCLVFLSQKTAIASQLFYIPTDEIERSIVFVCALFSFITCLVTYAVKKKRRQSKFGFTSFLGALFSDFWFDEFVTRKILSFIYFVWCFVCLTFMFYYLVSAFQGSAVSFLFVFSYLTILVVGRVVLESFSAVFRIAENTTSLLNIESNDSQGKDID